MTKSSVLIAVAVGSVLCVIFASLSVEGANLFVWLFVLLVVSGAVLWPRAGRDQRAELELERAGWADRIELPRQKATPARPEILHPKGKNARRAS